jgi:hypothetical protein
MCEAERPVQGPDADGSRLTAQNCRSQLQCLGSGGGVVKRHEQRAHVLATRTCPHSISQVSSLESVALSRVLRPTMLLSYAQTHSMACKKTPNESRLRTNSLWESVKSSYRGNSRGGGRG